MATYVLVHGGWAGGWQWKEVASIIRTAGHEVFTPTLTGLGERVHLATPTVGVATHIQDILMVLQYEDLHDVILVGYSYSGMIVTGVAERAPERLAHLVYLDAFVPTDGQTLADIFGAETLAYMTHMANTYGDGWRLPHDAPDAQRRTPQPFNPNTPPFIVNNPKAAALPHTFIYCALEKELMGPIGVPITRAANLAKSDPRWRYRELPTGHVPVETMPRELAALLLELA